MNNDPKFTLEDLPLGEQLKRILNSASRENESGTPDFILAEYMIGALFLFEAAVNQRDKWHGLDDRLGSFKLRKNPAPTTTPLP